jgi:amino acid transporter
VSRPTPTASIPPRRSSGLHALPDRLLNLHRSSGQLGFLLAWAVVFADIGTSIYYVPGLLFDELGRVSPSPAAAFVLATGLVFILLSLKYVEVAARYPDGGGVVSVASDAFGPMIGCLGGILISVDYFLTGAISSVSGFEYLGAIVPAVDQWLVVCACGAVILLGCSTSSASASRPR